MRFSMSRSVSLRLRMAALVRLSSIPEKTPADLLPIKGVFWIYFLKNKKCD